MPSPGDLRLSKALCKRLKLEAKDNVELAKYKKGQGTSVTLRRLPSGLFQVLCDGLEIRSSVDGSVVLDQMTLVDDEGEPVDPPAGIEPISPSPDLYVPVLSFRSFMDLASDDTAYPFWTHRSKLTIKGAPDRHVILAEPVTFPGGAGTGYYHFAGGGNDTRYKAVLEASGHGGGFGAARSDEADPAHYRWSGPLQLGVALGLDPRCHVPWPAQTSPLVTRDAPLPDHHQDKGAPVTFHRTNVPVGSQILYYRASQRSGKRGTFAEAPAVPVSPRIPDFNGLVGSGLSPTSDGLFKPGADVSLDPKSQQDRLRFETEPGSDVIAVRRKQKLVPLRFASAKRQPPADRVFQALLSDKVDTVRAFLRQLGVRADDLSANRYLQLAVSRDPELAKEADDLGIVSVSTSKPSAPAPSKPGAAAPAASPPSGAPAKKSKVNAAGTSAPSLDVNVLVDQEWCHLWGHGAGGPDELPNFVAGSHYANTEQLAIEMGQRVSSYEDLYLCVSAFRIRGSQLARWFRYKIYKGKDKDKKVPLFDHVFDGQSQAFDYNQFKILKTTVERVVAVAMGDAEAYEARIQDRFKRNLKELELDEAKYVNQPDYTVPGSPVGAAPSAQPVSKKRKQPEDVG